MDTEFEAKFYPVDKNSLRNKLKSVGAKLVVPERKMFRLIADWQDNPVIKKKSYLRIRDEGDLVRVSLKNTARENGKLTDQKEIDVEVSDFNKAQKILEGCGINFNRKQETMREEWEFDGAQVTIDTWPGLETLSEIEADSEERVKEIALKLGFDWGDRMIIPAAEVYAKVYALPMKEILKNISDITFRNNPFRDLKKVWGGD